MNQIIRTKIVCTIGPATESVSQLKKLYDAGMTVARINMSHGNHLQYRKFIKNIKAVSEKIAILIDTQGPEIRTGDVKPNTILKDGQKFTLTNKKCLGDNTKAYISYHKLVDDVKPGDALFIDSGFLSLKVLKTTKTDIICKVLAGGPLGNHKGVNNPSSVSKIASVTKKDREDIKFGLAHDIDFIAASFVRKPEDIKTIRSLLKKHPHVKIIAKIENALAVSNLDGIIKEADAVMVARGDLGIEISQDKLPIVQKEIILKCNLAGKPVITATQMLESMVEKPLPTRAESTDVANAILDGTDAVMLSEETAIGKYPDTAVKMMVKISKNTEKFLELHRHLTPESTADAIALAINHILENTDIDKVVVCTRSGYSARLVAKYRPHSMIIAATNQKRVVRRMGLYWGVYPVLIENNIKSTRQLIYHSLKNAVKAKLLKKSERAIITAGHPYHLKNTTNLIEIHKVSDLLHHERLK
ncbi:pyruvate kinase [Nanoarchaeota archaeon]